MDNRQIIRLHENEKFKGVKGTLPEQYGTLYYEEVTATTEEGENTMPYEVDLVKQKLENLEQQFDEKLSARDKLIDAKFENLSLQMNANRDMVMSKIDNLNDSLKKDIEIITNDKTRALEESIIAKNKENRNFTWVVMGFAVALATLLATLVPIFF